MKKNKLKKNFKKAFTLVELIIVIAVIAILAVFLIPNFSNVLGDTQVTQVKNDTKQIQQTVQAYINQTGAVPVFNSNPTASQVLEGGIGVSRAAFQAEAYKKDSAQGATKTYYAIDMDALTKTHTNIDDGTTKVAAMITSVPSTSAVKDIDSKTTYVSSKNVKNTSVVYVIDADLNVYATWNKAVKKTGSTAATLPTTGYRAFNTNNTTGTDETFKMDYEDNIQVAASINVDDSNYR